MTIDVESVAKDAREHFSLADRLKNRTLRTAEVTVFTDDELGQRHATAELEVRRLEAAKEIAGEDWAGETALRKARKELKTLTDDLKRKRVTLHLRAVPQVIVDDGRRVARKFMDIKGEVPAEREAELNGVITAHLLSKATTSWFDHDYEETNPSLDLADAVALRNFLPPHEKLKIDAKLGELQYADTISATVTSDPDF